MKEKADHEAGLKELRAELDGLKLKPLTKRAKEEGVDETKLAELLAEGSEEGEEASPRSSAAEKKRLVIEMVMGHAALKAVESKIVEAEDMEHGLDKAEAMLKLKDKQRNAAVKIQSWARGTSRAERRKFQAKRREREAAAVKIQAISRGRAERKRFASRAAVWRRRRPRPRRAAGAAREDGNGAGARGLASAVCGLYLQRSFSPFAVRLTTMARAASPQDHSYCTA